MPASLESAPFDIEPIDATFGAYIRGIKLRSLSGTAFQVLYAAWLEYALLVFEDQFLTRDEQEELALRFGKLEFSTTAFTNVDKDGVVHSDADDDVVKSQRGNEKWHHDSTYMPVQSKGSVYTAEVVPSKGAQTGWADMRAAYEALSTETQEYLSGLQAHHSLYYSQGRAGYLPKKNEDGRYGMYGYHNYEPSLRPLVKVHPETGRTNLLIGRHAYGITGLSDEESVALLDKLNNEACQPPRTYHHQWAPGEAVIWDNRCLMHRVTPYDMTEPRVMWHTRVAGDLESELALNHSAEKLVKMDRPEVSDLEAASYTELGCCGAAD